MILASVCAGHRVDYDVVVQMVLVQMGSNHHLKVRPKQLSGKLYANGMSLLRCHLTGGKGLNEMVA